MVRPINRFFSELLTAHESKDYARGLRAAQAAHEACPDEHSRTWYWRACMQSLLGNAGEALEALRDGVAEGAWWSPRLLQGDPDLAAIRESSGFIELKAECEKRFLDKQAKSRPLCLVLAPAAGLYAPKTLFILHWQGDTARRFAAYWQQLIDEGWTIVVPQSSQVFDSAGYCWDDAELAKAEIRQHLEDCRGKRGIDSSGMILAGASQGARLAFEIAQETGLPYLCAIPSFPAGYDAAAHAPANDYATGAFLLGGRDPVNSRALIVIGELQRLGAQVHVRTMDEVGHDFPEDFASHVSIILEQITGGQTAPLAGCR